MKITTAETSDFRGIFESVSSIIFEANMVVKEDGIMINAMDSSHICLVSIFLKKADFDIYEVDEELTLGINLEDMVKILRRTKNDDDLTLKHDANKKQIIIEMKSTKSSRSFTLSLIDIDAEEINIESLNEMEFPNKGIFPVSFVDDAIKDAEIYSEVLNITSEEDKINFTSQGNIGSMSNDINKGELDDYHYTEDSAGIFAISYLKNIIKIKSISSILEMSVKSDAPLKLEFSILKNDSKILYFLAPRVEEEDDMYDDDDDE